MLDESILKDVTGEEYIPVAYAPDDKYVWLTLISMVSVAENTKQKIDFIILYSYLSDESMKILDFINTYEHCRISYIQINMNIFKNFKNASWVTVQAWFRVLIPSIFNYTNKAIYLDCDTMLRGDIKEFYDIDIDDVLVGAVTDIWNIKSNAKRLKMKSDSYFNSGVLLINCKKWREENLFEKIKQNAIDNPDIKHGDQDTLNFVIDENKKVLSKRYNYLETWWNNYYKEYEGDDLTDYEQSAQDPLIVHFTAFKPYEPKSRHSRRKEWWNYAKKTPYYTKLLERYKDDSERYVDSLPQK